MGCRSCHEYLDAIHLNLLTRHFKLTTDKYFLKLCLFVSSHADNDVFITVV